MKKIKSNDLLEMIQNNSNYKINIPYQSASTLNISKNFLGEMLRVLYKFTNDDNNHLDDVLKGIYWGLIRDICPIYFLLKHDKNLGPLHYNIYGTALRKCLESAIDLSILFKDKAAAEKYKYYSKHLRYKNAKRQVALLVAKYNNLHYNTVSLNNLYSTHQNLFTKKELENLKNKLLPEDLKQKSNIGRVIKLIKKPISKFNYERWTSNDLAKDASNQDIVLQNIYIKNIDFVNQITHASNIQSLESNTDGTNYPQITNNLLIEYCKCLKYILNITEHNFKLSIANNKLKTYSNNKIFNI